MAHEEDDEMETNTAEHIDYRIGRQVARLRGIRDLKQQPFAELVNEAGKAIAAAHGKRWTYDLDQGDVSDLERGHRPWRSTLLEAVASVLGVGVWELMPGAPVPLPPGAMLKVEVTPRQHRVLRAMQAGPAEEDGYLAAMLVLMALMRGAE